MENNAPSNYFIVQYNTSFNSDQWVSAKTVDSTQNTANIVLRSWANYTFRVIATNKIGQSFPSLHTKKVCTIYPDRPEKNPSNVRSIGNLRGYLVIEWTVGGIVNVIDYGKCSKILNTFLCLLSNKMLVIKVEIYKMLVRIANREDLYNYKSSVNTKYRIRTIVTGLQIRVRFGKLFSLFLIKTYSVGTPKNCLNETVLLTIQNTCLNSWVRK